MSNKPNSVSFFKELKRRNVFRVGIAYAMGSWLLLQISDILVPLLGFQDTVQKVVLLVLAIGFVPALIVAWAFELTPDGIRKEKDVERDRSVAPQTARKLDRTIIVILALCLALVFLLYKKLSPKEITTPSPQPAEVLNTDTNGPVGNWADNADFKSSMAVLPFVNMSSDPEQEYFSDGLSEELLNRLAKNDQLKVAARTSAFQFKGQNLDIEAIGRQLNVANVLEGSVRKVGDRLRITAQLIQVENGYNLWSETYDRKIGDVFAIQEEISLAISKALEAELGVTTSSITVHHPSANFDAYNLYLQARYLLAKRGGQNMLDADDLFTQAVALDPNFAAAWAGKAFNAALLYNYGRLITADEGLSMTLEAANHALALDPDNAEAYTAIGRAYANNMEWREAQQYYERAYELSPNDVAVLNLYGDFQGFVLGNHDQAISLKMQAIAKDPLSSMLLSDLARMKLNNGQFEEALSIARKAVYLDADSLQNVESLIYSLVMTGKFDETAALLAQFKRTHLSDVSFQNRLNEWSAVYYYAKGDLESLQMILTECIRFIRSNPDGPNAISYAQIAFFSLRWQKPVEVLPLLEKALEAKDTYLVYPAFFYLPERISKESGWLDFWSRPEFKELLDIRRTRPYSSNGIWLPRIETNLQDDS